MTKAAHVWRSQNYNFAAIMEIWDKLFSSYSAHYKPGSYVTNVEQLLAFKERCPFKMYIPNKPA